MTPIGVLRSLFVWLIGSSFGFLYRSPLSVGKLGISKFCGNTWSDLKAERRHHARFRSEVRAPPPARHYTAPRLYPGLSNIRKVSANSNFFAISSGIEPDKIADGQPANSTSVFQPTAAESLFGHHAARGTLTSSVGGTRFATAPPTPPLPTLSSPRKPCRSLLMHV